MRNIVLVKGNIIGTAGHHHATEWVALAPESWEGEAAQVIEGDLDDNGMSRYMENNDEEGWD